VHYTTIMFQHLPEGTEEDYENLDHKANTVGGV
jgi:hypothetical protein